MLLDLVPVTGNKKLSGPWTKCKWLENVKNILILCGFSGFWDMHTFPNRNWFIKATESRFICKYIFIVIALDETIIRVAVQFSMQNIYESCDLGRAL